MHKKRKQKWVIMHKSDTQVIIVETEFILRTELACDLPGSLLGLTTERKCNAVQKYVIGYI